MSWISNNRFFDPRYMYLATLKQLQQELHFMDNGLPVLLHTATNLELKVHSNLHEADRRNQFVQKVIDTQPGLVVLYLSHIFEHQAPEGLDPRKRGLMRFTVGLSLENFQWLFEAMEVHPLFLECLHSHVGHLASYETFDDADGLPTHLHLLVKVPSGGHLEAAFYIRYEYSSRRVLVIVAGNDFKGQIEQLVSCLERCEPPIDPFAVALSIVSRYVWFLETQKIQVDHAVIMTERETGRGAVAYSDGNMSHSISPDKFDLTFMHWIEGNQRNIVYASEFQCQLARFLIEYHTRQLQRIQRQDSPGKQSITTTTLLQDLDLTPSQRTLHSRLLSHLSLSTGLHSASLIIRERIQRQLSAADSIINQYDNKVSLSNAEANTSIAEQSRRIADESKAIASETRRDSTSMKTIASLTMVYLPATFAASIFSTGFFSYTEGGTEKVKVNPQIWKLFVVAIVLSVATISIWVWLNKSGIPRWLDWARQKDKNKNKDPETPVSDDTPPTLSRDVNLDVLRARLIRPPLEVTSAPKISLPV